MAVSTSWCQPQKSLVLQSSVYYSFCGVEIATLIMIKNKVLLANGSQFTKFANIFPLHIILL